LELIVQLEDNVVFSELDSHPWVELLLKAFPFGSVQLVVIPFASVQLVVIPFASVQLVVIPFASVQLVVIPFESVHLVAFPFESDQGVAFQEGRWLRYLAFQEAFLDSVHWKVYQTKKFPKKDQVEEQKQKASHSLDVVRVDETSRMVDVAKKDAQQTKEDVEAFPKDVVYPFHTLLPRLHPSETFPKQFPTNSIDSFAISLGAVSCSRCGAKKTNDAVRQRKWASGDENARVFYFASIN
jgi:hypothetical protein